jgi:post-segregation antitoxin (ccd killing protein)
VYRERLRPHLYEDPATMEPSELQRELAAAGQTIRDLQRQVVKDQGRYAELARAYQMTVANLVKTTGECALLERDRDMWRQRAEARSTATIFDAESVVLSSAEIAAIRKAMARLHHPDTGGDEARMIAWNTLLDNLEGDTR